MEIGTLSKTEGLFSAAYGKFMLISRFIVFEQEWECLWGKWDFVLANMEKTGYSYKI